MRAVFDTITIDEPSFNPANGGNIKLGTVSPTGYVERIQGATGTVGTGIVAVLAWWLTAAPQPIGTNFVIQGSLGSPYAVYLESYGNPNYYYESLRSAVVTKQGNSNAAYGLTLPGCIALDLVIGLTAWESRSLVTGDNDNTSGKWSTHYSLCNSTTGTDDTRLTIGGQNKIVTANGTQTYDSDCSSYADYVAMAACFAKSIVSP